MMTATHMLIGAALGYILGLSQPEIVFPLVTAGIIGGLIPDLDVILEHRKSLHFPAYYSILGGISVTSAIFFPSENAFMATVFFGSAALHCFTDVFVGTIGSTISNGEKDCTVYLHPENRWIGSKDIIRFSGSPEDLLTSLLLAAPLIYLLPYTLKLVIGLILLTGLTYSFYRWKEYRKVLKKQNAPTIEELFEEAKKSRSQ